MSIYNYLAKKANGDILSMQTYRGKVMLITNTASQCQFTYQYEDLQKLYTKYEAQGLEILSFPCDQFGNQNPESGEQSAAQCKGQFGVTYPIFDKVQVNGEMTHPLFNYLKHEVDVTPMATDTMQQKMLYNRIVEEHPDYLLGHNIRWNFTKFLVDQHGKVITRFEPNASMLDIEHAIQQLFA
ncbi:glutathione peroxidase [Solibacillus sp. FSL K6-1523]|uniref:glutathione peroxidase n=1 Tax=Solibacillus sp. FSL K6-1523 TaxID=2921471 RepID=UPI0030FAB8D1